MNARHATQMLSLTFGLVLTILLASGWFGLSRMALINQGVKEIMEGHWNKRKASHNGLRYSNANSRDTLRFFLEQDGDEARSLLANCQNNLVKEEQMLREISLAPASADESALVAEIESSLVLCNASYASALGLLEVGDQHALDKNIRKMADLLNAHNRLWEALAELQNEDMEKAAHTAEGIYVSSRRQVSYFLVLGFILTLSGGALVTRKMTADIAIWLRAEKAMRETQDSLEMRVEQRAAELKASNSALAEAHESLQTSEHRLRSVLESEPECVQQISEDGTVLDMNPAGLRLVEAEHLDQVRGHSIYDLIVPESHAVFRNLHQAVFQGETMVAEFEVAGLKGTRRWIRTRACPLLDAGGTIAAQLAVSSDVTEARLKENSLYQTQALLNSVLESLPIGVFLKESKDLRIILWNRANEQMHGLKSTALVGKNDHDIFPPEQADYFTLKDRETLIKGDVLDIPEETLQTPHLGTRILHTKKVPIFDSKGKAAYLLGISEDITERKQAEANLARLHEDLLKVSRMAGMAEVATGVLHNVGNVLNSVNVSASIASDKVRKSKSASIGRIATMLEEHKEDIGAFLTLDAKGRQVPGFLSALADHLEAERNDILGELASLQKNVDHIKAIVSMQQNYAKVTGISEAVDVVELLEDTLRMNEASFARHEVEMVREFTDLPVIRTDKHKLLQILVNLVANAKHACEESGKEERRVTVSAIDTGKRLQISVADTGVGISDDNLTRIFNHGFTTRKDGHGFGLHSGALAAKEMGGVLTAQSNGPGRGALFVLDLPLNKQDEI